jgi:molecular chaperone GrpE
MTDTEQDITEAPDVLEAPGPGKSQGSPTSGAYGVPNEGPASAREEALEGSVGVPPEGSVGASEGSVGVPEGSVGVPPEGSVGDVAEGMVAHAREDGEAAAIEGELGELVKTVAQRDEYLALAQRTQADFENYRKRVARDAAQAQDRGVAKLAKELLPALDNLDRAIEAAEAEDPLLAGVRLVRSEIAAALARVGIEAFAPLGEPFDPNQQEAMAQQPVEGLASGTVAEVYQDGYRMGETIIRPARVLVAA